MWVRVCWSAALLVALGIQKALGNNPVVSGLTGFALVFLISYVYFYRPICLWGEWDPPMKEIESNRSSECRENIDLDSSDGDDEKSNLFSSEEATEHREGIDLEGSDGDDEKNNLLSSEEATEDVSRLDTEKETITQTKAKKLPKARVERIHFLTNVKIFLTFIVVFFHCTGSFGGLGKNWTLVVGLYELNQNKMRTLLYALDMLSQSYFMSLFFFISGYFTPSNYERKGGEQFVKDRAKRLLIPALVTTFVLVPLTTMYAQWSASYTMIYIPFTEHTWFIYWLLLFEWAYVTIRKERLQANEPSRPVAFPNTLRRCALGILVCGMATYIFAIEAKIKIFWSMPTISPGSLFCDILLFLAGTVAKESGWISTKSTIAEQLDLPLRKFRRIVLTEGMLIFFLKAFRLRNTVAEILYFMIAGIFCIDMSICVLQFFQQYANKPPPAFLSDAAFTVYLIHPFVITVCTSIFVKKYNELYDDQIEFDSELGVIFPVSQSHLSGPIDGMFHYFIGFLIVLALSNAIVWPVAWILRKLPILNQYL